MTGSAGPLYVRRLREEFATLHVEVSDDKTRTVELSNGESFGFLGFEFRRVRSRAGRWMPLQLPQRKKRTHLQHTLKAIFRRSRSRPVGEAIAKINPILRGWANHFAHGHSSRCFNGLRDWVEKRIRRRLARARQRQGLGWKRWSRRWLYEDLGLFKECRVSYQRSTEVAPA